MRKCEAVFMVLNILRKLYFMSIFYIIENMGENMDYFGLHKLFFVKAAGKWKVDEETGDLKAHFETKMFSRLMGGLKKEEVATRKELKDLQVYVYERLRQLACVNDDYELGDKLTLLERYYHQRDFNGYSRAQEILNDTLSAKPPTPEC